MTLSFRIPRLYAYFAISAVISLGIWVLLLLPNFLAGRGWSSQEIGWAVGAYFLVNLVCQAASGQLAVRYGNIATALWGAAAATAGGVCYLGALHFPALIFVARTLHGAGAAMIYVGALMDLLQAVPPELRGRMIGYFGLPGFFMLGIGPPLSEWLIYRWGFEGIFFSVPVMFVVVAAVLARIPRSIERAPAGQGSLYRALRASVDSLGSILLFSVCFGFCFSAWNSFLAPAVRNVGPGAVSMFGLGYGGGAVLTRLGLSHKLEFGKRRLYAIALLGLYGAGLAAIPACRALSGLVLVGFVCGMIHGTYYPSLSSLAAERFPRMHAAQATSLYLSANAVGLFVGPPLWGMVADRVGYGPMFAAAGLLLAGATAWFVVAQLRAGAGEEEPGLRVAERRRNM
jgi:MFS family permease